MSTQELASGLGWLPLMIVTSALAVLGAANLAGTSGFHPPATGTLLAGFAVMAGGLVALTHRRSHSPLRSRAGTVRVLSIILIYALCSTWFMRVIAPAVLGREESPWLEALSDVLCVTLGLFIWVVALSDRYTARDFGLHGGAPRRLFVATGMGLGAVVACAFWSYRRILLGDATVDADHVIFALLFSILGSAVPEELLFRGLLMSSFNGRTSRWFRVIAPALIYTAVRSLRWIPGTDMPTMAWFEWLLGTVLPLGLWWGLMRDLAGGSLWPGLISHVLIEFGTRLAGSPIYGNPAP